MRDVRPENTLSDDGPRTTIFECCPVLDLFELKQCAVRRDLFCIAFLRLQ